MKSALIFALLGLAFVSPSNGASDVLDLSDDFESEIDGYDLMLVEFFAPWCGHCKKLAPEFDTAATALKKIDPPVALAKVDCTSDNGKATCGKYGVSGYPTLKIFRNGELSSDYEGGRTSGDMVSTMKKMSGPMAKEIKSVDELEKAFKSTDLVPVVVGFFSKEGKEKEEFVKSAANLFENYKVVYSLSEEVNNKFGFSDAVVLFRPPVLKNKFEDDKVSMTDSITRANIEKFVRKNGLGLCGVMNKDNQNLFKKPLIVAYYDVDYTRNPRGTNYWRNRVMKVGKTYADKDLTFAVASRADFSPDLAPFDFSPSEKVVVAAWSAKGQKFKMEETFTPDGKAFDAFVGQYLAGELKPHLKSESIPDSNDGPVKIVVAEQFDEIVMDPTKDVLIEFYAPWCGHCKQLEPKYEELGEKLKDFEHVVIAKMDATANDVPPSFEVSGFPTIYWAPADGKSNPKKYQGGREVDDFVNFITKESTKPVNVAKSKKSKKEL